MPDPLVDRLEVVDVENEDREAAAVAVRARAFAQQRLVEEAPVAEPRQRVRVGQPPSLPVTEGVVECRYASADEVVEPGAAELARRSRDDGQRAERPELTAERHRQLRPGLALSLRLLT